MSNIEEQPNQLFDIPEHLITPKSDNIYTTTAKQFNEIFTLYKQSPLPNNVLFPWLHGVDGNNNQQNLFFGVRRSLVPNYRGLMVVHCHDLENTARLVETVLPKQIVSLDPAHPSEFINSYNKELSINLRNFQNQIARFSTVCDLVLYGSNAHEMATRVSAAQKKLYEQRSALLENTIRIAGKKATSNANRIIYKVIVIEDDFSVFERHFPELVLYDSTGLLLRARNFFEMEHAQMREMSKAVEITKNVWMGNTADVPVATHDIGTSFSSSSSDFSFDEDPNPHKFSICVEAHDLADMPMPSTLTLARETLNDLKDGEMPPEIIHFDVFASGVSNEKSEFREIYTRLIQLLMFIEDQARRNRRTLIHCSDGYTETSLIGLSWIMYHLKLSLPDAYLYLQKYRSFFVYAADVPALRKIEQMLFEDHDSLEPLPKRKKSVTADTLEAIRTLDVGQQINQNGGTHFELEEDDETNSLDYAMDESIPSHSGDNRVLQSDTYLNQVSNGDIEETIPGNIYRQLQLSPTKEEERLYPWFFSPRFEGSFPSRILPFLYLGNLNHATNPEMLKALNITHVVSVGEKADLSSKDFQLLYLDHLYDDGIDSIGCRLDSVMEFVEDARIKGSQCLIHCRVGVSRSAAITICYVMKHLKYTLVQAYLFVRARRLNVIIQPNLKFMYEMLQLEQKEKGTLTITWPILCSEVYNLNFAYRDLTCS